jgi:hypothetical protein
LQLAPLLIDAFSFLARAEKERKNKSLESCRIIYARSGWQREVGGWEQVALSITAIESRAARELTFAFLVLFTQKPAQKD